jgi:hypothetical protein
VMVYWTSNAEQREVETSIFVTQNHAKSAKRGWGPACRPAAHECLMLPAAQGAQAHSRRANLRAAAAPPASPGCDPACPQVLARAVKLPRWVG